MDIMKGKWKKNALLKALERCGSLNKKNKKKRKEVEVAPEGYFAVYVGPEKQRFVIKTELANHPLFKVLLENAELEYGYNSSGPILIPCDVDLFYKVLAEMTNCDEGEDYHGCGYGAAVHCFSPGRSHEGYGGSGYRLLSPSRMRFLICTYN